MRVPFCFPARMATRRPAPLRSRMAAFCVVAVRWAGDALLLAFLLSILVCCLLLADVLMAQSNELIPRCFSTAVGEYCRSQRAW